MFPKVSPVSLALACLLLPAATAAQTAAEADFRSALEMTEEQRAKLPWYCAAGYVQPPGYEGASPPSDDTPVTVSARRAEHVMDESTTFSGSVIADQQTRLMTGDRLTTWPESETFRLDGNVIIREPDLLIHGESASGNLFEGTGVIDTASFLMHRARMRGAASQIQQLADKNVVFINGSLTRCDPGDSSWEIRSRRIDLNTNMGYGVSRGTTLRVRNLPVVYMPYLRFPIDDQRHSGFLMPTGGRDSNGGTEVIIPYYFNLAPNYDATYTLRSLWKRGQVHELETRHLSRNATTELTGAFLATDKIYDDRRDVDEDTGEFIDPFVEKDRWLLNFQHAGRWGDAEQGEVTTRASFATVSDIDYLSDIGGDIGSRSLQNATDEVGDSISDVRRIPALRRHGTVSWHKDAVTASIMVERQQQMDASRREAYQRLPQAEFKHKDRYGWLETSTEFQYSFFERKNNTSRRNLARIRGERVLLDWQASVPMNTVWGYAEPAVYLQHREYDLRDQPASTPVRPEVTIPSFSFDTGLYFDRFFRLADLNLQQTLEPRLYYLYTEYEDQSFLPAFDASNPRASFAQLTRRNRFVGPDRLSDANHLSVGLSSEFLDTDSGRTLGTFEIGQAYYFREREVVFRAFNNEDTSVPTSPIFASVTSRLTDSFSARYGLEWEPRDGDTNRSNVSIQFKPDERRVLNLRYGYTGKHVRNQQLPGGISNSQESELSFAWPIIGRWSAMGLWHFSLDDRVTIESLAGIEYNDCCWKARLAFRRYLQEPQTLDLLDPTGAVTETIQVGRAESRVMLEIEFKGLGQLSKRLDQLLESAIPGYPSGSEPLGR